jgi:hypothetical protein
MNTQERRDYMRQRRNDHPSHHREYRAKAALAKRLPEPRFLPIDTGKKGEICHACKTELGLIAYVEHKPSRYYHRTCLPRIAGTPLAAEPVFG